MDDDLKKVIREKEKRHKRYLFFYHTGEFFQYFFLPTQALVYKAKKGCLILIVMIISHIWLSNFWYDIIATILFFAVLSLIGKYVHKVCNKKLYDLGQECSTLYHDYFVSQCDAYGLDHSGEAEFPDNITIGRTYVRTRMREYHGDITICQLEKIDELLKYDKYKRERGLQGTLNDKIASVDFNKKFGIIPGYSDMECLKYFSPTMQVKMIKSSAIMNFSDIHIDGDYLKLKTKKEIASLTGINIYTKKKLKKYFKEIDVYCKEMREMADEAYADFMKIDFLRGTLK